MDKGTVEFYRTAIETQRMALTTVGTVAENHWETFADDPTIPRDLVDTMYKAMVAISTARDEMLAALVKIEHMQARGE